MKKLTITMTRREVMLGWLYLGLELFVLPNLFAFGNGLLDTPLSAARLNFLFFVVNFCAIAGIFHPFLRESLLQAKEQKILSSAALGLAFYWLGSLALTLLPFDFHNVNDASIAAMAAEDYTLMAVGTVLLVPIVEETLYRGVLFGSLYDKNPPAGFLISTLIFCAIHVMGYIGTYPVPLLALCFLQYVPAGLSLAWAYARSGSIFAPLLMHTIINAVGIYAVR